MRKERMTGRGLRLLGVALGLAFLSAKSLPAADFDTKVDSFGVWQGDPKKQIAQIDISRDLGFLSAKVISFSGHNYSTARVAVGTPGAWYLVQKDGSIVRADPSPNLPRGAAASIVSLMKDGVADSFNLALRDKSDCFATTENIGPAEGNDFQPLSNGKVFSLINLKDAAERKNAEGILTVSISLYFRDGAVNKCDRFQFAWKPEYFYGESTTAGTPTALMARLWPVYANIDAGDAQGLSEADIQTKATLATALAHDLNSLYFGKVKGEIYAAAITKSGYYPIPYKLDDPRLARISRTGTASPYLEEYLRVVRAKEKTINAFQVDVAEKSAEKSYDFTKYSAITKDEGVELAKAALRYFTWGVEYTLPKKDDSGDVAQNTVYSGNSAMFDAWVNGHRHDNKRNHYTGDLAPIPQTQTGDRILLNGIVFNDPEGKAYTDILLNNGTGAVVGNPIPYLAKGIDSPRTFNYKMIEQLKARRVWQQYYAPKAQEKFVVPNSTLASSALPPGGNTPTNNYEDYLRKYDGDWTVSLNDGSFLTKKGNQRIKPFLPPNDSNRMLRTIQSAGVDAAGFLVGAIAQTSVRDDVVFQNNEKRSAKLEEYFSFHDSLIGSPNSGLDSKGYPYITETNGLEALDFEGSDGLRLTKEDIEHSSMLIPTNQARQGDIVVKIGDLSNPPASLAGALRIGIIVSVPNNKAESGIKVVFVSPQYRQVRLMTLSTILDDNDGPYQLRRILKNESLSGRTEGGKWDVMDKTPNILELALKTPGKDAANARPSFSERWIPNTGEYLEFQVLLKLNSETGYGIDLPKYLKTGNYQLSIDPPTDRRTAPDSLDDATSNIVINRGTGFELAIKPKNGFNEEKPEKFALFNNDAGTYEALSTSGLILDRDGLSEKLSVKKDATSGWYILCYDKQPCTFGIRPLVAGIRPGDDIFMSVSIKKKDEDNTVTSLFASTPVDDSYLAVYDKKMLWRANLYIAEPGRNINSIRQTDWNADHPWDAPADSNTEISRRNAKELPAWWSAEWGYNQWNRRYVLNPQGIGDALALVNPTPESNGKQSLMLSDYPWTPIRQLSANAGDNENFHSLTIAYDYPYDGMGIRAWDSPFDFVFKMHEQRRAMSAHFSPLSIFNPNTPGFFPTIANGSVAIPGQTKTHQELANWPTTMAPLNQWKYYWKDGAGAYWPGIGMRQHDVAGNATDNDEAGLDAISLANRVSAGVDCVGFVLRSASYTNNGYTWTSFGGGIPRDRAEGNQDPDATSRNTTIPREPDYGKNIISRIAINDEDDNQFFTLTAGSINPLAPTLDYFNTQIKPAFLRIVPGDVIWYSGDHVGIIEEVDYQRIMQAGSVYDLMRALRIIESVFSGKVNYVHTRNMLQGGGLEFREDKNASWHIDFFGNLRSWNVVRLIK